MYFIDVITTRIACILLFHWTRFLSHFHSSWCYMMWSSPKLYLSFMHSFYSFLLLYVLCQFYAILKYAKYFSSDYSDCVHLEVNVFIAFVAHYLLFESWSFESMPIWCKSYNIFKIEEYFSMTENKVRDLIFNVFKGCKNRRFALHAFSKKKIVFLTDVEWFVTTNRLAVL